MQLQKQLSRTLGTKKYSTYTVVIPPKTVKELGWKKGDRLEPKIENGGLFIIKTAGAFNCYDELSTNRHKCNIKRPGKND
uniref:Putative antitoxin family protein n=1 Tax=viral metagenome TaxID=1070528 RepID=A0A6M3XXR7_9ZZZZ